MTTQQNDAMRAAFETWARKPKVVVRGAEGNYEDDAMNIAWRAWQAALASKPVVGIDWEGFEELRDMVADADGSLLAILMDEWAAKHKAAPAADREGA